MAKKHCKECGTDYEDNLKECPYCGTPADKEAPQPVGALHAAPEITPRPVPPVFRPVQNTGINPNHKTSHSGRNVMLVVLALILLLVLAAVGGYYFRQQSGPEDHEFVAAAADSAAADSAMMGDSIADTLAEDSPVAEPEETLEISNKAVGKSRQLLATYRYGDLKREYYWDGNNRQLSIYDENGKCLKKHDMEKYNVLYGVEGANGVVAKLYNHHVYFVGSGGGTMDVYTIFYLTPREGNGIHVIGHGIGENGYKLQKNSVRVQHLTCINEETAECEAAKEYEKRWETIPLQ